jgi:hypothetical protein
MLVVAHRALSGLMGRAAVKLMRRGLNASPAECADKKPRPAHFVEAKMSEGQTSIQGD